MVHSFEALSDGRFVSVMQPSGSMNGFSTPAAGDDGWQISGAAKLQRVTQYWLDRSTPHVGYRWIASAVVLLLYGVRVYLLQGFYIVTYALGIFNLNLLLGFISPQIDPELEGPTLPSKSDEEFRPFVRRLPEFKFWLSAFKSLLLGMAATFFPFLDVPVFWPILLMYFIILFVITMKRQIKQMIKYRYVPFSWGKKSYAKEGRKSSK